MGLFSRRGRRNKGPLRAAVYGFCHAQALHEILASDPRVAGELEFVALNECFKMTDAEMDELVGSIAPQLDVLIYQPVSGRTLGKQVSGAEIREIVRDDCLRITFPIFRCDFYTPHFSYPVPEAPRPPFDYIDFGIVDQFLRGTPRSAARPGAQSLDFDDRVVSEIRESTLTEAHGRDHDERGPLDVRLADLIRERIDSEPLFHTINHPGPRLMAEVAEQTIALLQREGVISSGTGAPSTADLFDDIHLPVHPSIQRSVEFTDDSPLLHKNRVYTDEEAVSATYEYLGSLDRAVVEASMDRFLESQPWAPKLFSPA